MSTRLGICVFVVGIVFTTAQAQVVVDGSTDLSYGAPIVVQTVETQFGDANPPVDTTGSELDAGYAQIEGGLLYIMLTGNLEPSFTKLSIFIDSRAGGENVLTSVPEYDLLNVSTNLGGMTFDTGFTADYHLFARWETQFEVDFVDRQGGGSSTVPGSTGLGSVAAGLISSGSISAGNVASYAASSSLSQNLLFAINDNNALGVTGGAGAANQIAAAAVATGMEFCIALADLGNPVAGTEIRIAAMIGNGDHNFWSNQILGGVPAPQGNLGGDGAGTFTGTSSGIDFNEFSGPQYFTIVVPESLPVELTSFEGSTNRRNVILTWSTASESNNVGFAVEREIATEVFAQMGFVEGHGTTDQTNTYSFEVKDVDPGIHRFRLKQMDFDGAFEYSPIVEVTVTVPDLFLLEPAYPNPFNPTTTVRFSVSATQGVVAELYDPSGRFVKELYSGLTPADQTQVLKIGATGLASGTYQVRVTGDRFVASEQITLLK